VIRKIILENYMSHARSELDLAEGLTLLVGPNNCGKSAVLSAIQTLARNRDGDFMVRHGSGEASITVEIDDGPGDKHVLSWRRKKSAVSYTIDGREIGRLKGSVPDDLHQFLKLPEVQPAAVGPAFDVHFAQQKFPIFLLDEPGSRAATFFSASSDAGRLLEIQDRHREKVRDQKGRRRLLASDVTRIEAELGRLADVEAVAPLLESAETEHKSLSEHVEATRALEEMIRNIESAQRQTELARQRLRACEPLQAPPAQEDEIAQHAMIASIATAMVRVREQMAQSKVLAGLGDVPTMDDLSDLSESIRRLAAGERTLKSHRASLLALEGLSDPPQLLDLAPLEALGQQFAETSVLVNKAMAEVTDCQRQLREVDGRIVVWARENPNCPVCGGEITPARLLEAGGHVHG
jgi:DNA repair exonuclease SbcCD ATPase subunit